MFPSMPASIVYGAHSSFYRRLSESAGMLVRAALTLLLANMHPIWRPWTVGVITEGWPGAAEAITVACTVALAGQLVALLSSARLVPLGVACVTASTSLAAGVVVYAEFPFDFGAIGAAWLDTWMALALLAALVTAAILLSARIGRLLVQVARED